MIRSARNGGFISPQNCNLRCQKLVTGFRICYIWFCQVFFQDSRDKHAVSWINKSKLIQPCTKHRGSSSCKANCVRRRVLITQFLSIKPWVGSIFKTGGSLAALCRYLHVSNHKSASIGFLRLNLTSILCSELYGQDCLQTYRYKS